MCLEISSTLYGLISCILLSREVAACLGTFQLRTFKAHLDLKGLNETEVDCNTIFQRALSHRNELRVHFQGEHCSRTC